MTTAVFADWLEAFNDAEYIAWVDNAETCTEKVAFMTKQYITFRISTKSAKENAVTSYRHRFSEFETMRNELKSTYLPLGILVPLLPSKKLITGGEDSMFLKERTQGLSLMCNTIASTPWFRHDRIWIDFLGGSGAGTWSSVGESMLLQMVNQLEPVGNAYARMNEVKDELYYTERKIIQLLTAARTMVSALETYEKNSVAMQQCLNDLAESEATVGKMCGGEVTSGSTLFGNMYKPTTSLAAFGHATEAVHKRVKDSPVYTCLLLISVLEHEIGRVDAFRELFQVHDKLLLEIDSLAQKEQKLRSAKELKQDQIAEAAKVVAAKRVQLINFYKALFAYTIPVNIRQRANNLRSSILTMGAIQSLLYNQQATVWENYFSEIQGSKETFHSSALESLDMLGIKVPAEKPNAVDDYPILAPLPIATKEFYAEALLRKSGDNNNS